MQLNFNVLKFKSHILPSCNIPPELIKQSPTYITKCSISIVSLNSVVSVQKCYHCNFFRKCMYVCSKVSRYSLRADVYMLMLHFSNITISFCLYLRPNKLVPVSNPFV